MAFLIGLLTMVMVLDCLVLIFLVLIQLPKKEAGAGLAFGGAATDALFGAGSGTVLTKITKYVAGVFFGLAIVLSLLQRNFHTRTASAFEQKLQQVSPTASMPGVPPRSPATPLTSPQTPSPAPAAATGTNALVIPPVRVEDTNLPLAIPPAPAPTAPTNK